MCVAKVYVAGADSALITAAVATEAASAISQKSALESLPTMN